ncbi:GATOR complex protein NPRL3 [Ctenocephalides felis]|uniref:GATOR complex protein NPRL3 n=1 Tax=Ctenocephalides felis TaxID=7515 RepID=UPI000E6E4D51|nr:GATOR complex protein NPRL3 [Ctenocephalides felis]
MEVNPLSIILVKSDSKGDRLLFRYPYVADIQNVSSAQNKRRNPYSMIIVEDLLQNPVPQTSNINKGQLTGFADEVLSTLFAVKPELCNKKFELKVNDVRFVGHPTLLQSKGAREDCASHILVNIVFALHAQASHSIVKCYYDLSKRLGTAIKHEEQRVAYLSEETKIMIAAHDELAANIDTTLSSSPFDLILKRSTLAQSLKTTFDDVSNTGLVNLQINRYLTVNFCLPQKAHQFHKPGIIVEPESIEKCLKSLRPYHGMLLLVDHIELMDCVGQENTNALIKMIQMYSPLKSLQALAADTEMPLQQVYQLVGHMVYWAKATIIYPLCENNVYVIASDAPLYINSPLVEKFSEQFPGTCLLEVISEFSLGTCVAHKLSPLQHPSQHSQFVQMLVWMLQHHLLVQLHTYIQFMVPQIGPEDISPWLMAERLLLKNIHSFNGDPMFNSHGSDLALSSRSHSHSHFNLSDDLTALPSYSHKSSASIPPSTSFASTENEISFVSVDEKNDDLFMEFTDSEREYIMKIPASSNHQDLALLARLRKKGYFQGEHHLEEIMYNENLQRSQILQLLDKFRDVLITFRTEDPVISILYSQE